MHKDRGRVLLAVRVHSLGWTLFLWAVVIAWVGVLAWGFLRGQSLRSLFQFVSNLLAVVVVIFGYLLHPRIKFYEEGVEIPPTRDYNRARYLRWDQIERWSWDGDRLILTGTSSVLGGGPVLGGSVRIPSGEHLAVDQVLEMRLPVR
jgi:hypothetical protein